MIDASEATQLVGLAGAASAALASSWWRGRSKSAQEEADGGVVRSDRHWSAARDAMVRTQLERRDVANPRVLAAMRAVPRHRFVPARYRDQSYDDHPLPIGFGQTISQPYIVAIMSQLCAPLPGERVLEVGTGSGYQAAVLAEMGAEVYGMEIVEDLGTAAGTLLAELGYERVHIRIGDGYEGWSDRAPYAAIVVAAAPPEVPSPLEEQLAVGGRLVIPVGRGFQSLMLVVRRADGFDRREVLPVRFVPMVGRAERD